MGFQLVQDVSRAWVDTLYCGIGPPQVLRKYSGGCGLRYFSGAHFMLGYL